MKLVTFTWSATVSVEDSFDDGDEDQCSAARSDAWNNIQKHDGELTDIQEEDHEP